MALELENENHQTRSDEDDDVPLQSRRRKPLHFPIGPDSTSVIEENPESKSKCEENPEAESKCEENPEAEPKFEENPEPETKFEENPGVKTKFEEDPEAESKFEEDPVSESTFEEDPDVKFEVDTEVKEKLEEDPESDSESESDAESEEENGVNVVKFGNGNHENGNTTVGETLEDVKGGGLEKMSIHFDMSTGIWKCNHCDWTYQSGDHTQNPKEHHTHMMLNDKTLEIAGTESTYGFSKLKYRSVETSIFEKSPANEILSAQNNRNHGKQEITNSDSSDNGIIQIDDIVPLQESDQEFPDLDVETVLKTQQTHDLFCPNCNSCITRRVILRKRKRNIQEVHHKIKRDKFETIVDSELNANSEILECNDDHDTVANGMEESLLTRAEADNNDDREPEVFRCLSCFSFFIPGKDFKLFRFFREKDGAEDMQSRQQPDTNRKWFFIFSSSKGKMAASPSGAANNSSDINSSPVSNNIQPQPEMPSVVTSTTSTTIIKTVKPAEDAISETGQAVEDENQLSESESSTRTGGFDTHAIFQFGNEEKNVDLDSTQSSTLTKTTITYSEERSYDAVGINKTGDLVQTHSETKTTNTMNSSTISSDNQPQYNTNHLLGISIDGTSALVNALKSAEDANLFEKTQPGQDTHSSSFQESTVTVQTSCTSGYGDDDITTQIKNSKISNDSALNVSPISLKTTIAHDGGRPDYVIEVNKTDEDLSIITDRVRAMIAQRAQNTAASSDEIEPLLESGIRVSVGEHGRVEGGEGYGWDILKSIVYGGLIESITSLGVVTSAAGAGAATVNVIALGLANLIGGLFIIAHDLWDLKDDHSKVASNQLEVQSTRYNEFLGRRQLFRLHIFVAILSYLIFGLIPPIVYGFSFRTSGDRDFKLASVAGASFLCISLLALGKGHVKKPPKSYIPTLLYYVTIAITASGVSYLAGTLLKRLLEHFGWSDSTLLMDALVPDRTLARPASWSSY